MADYYNAVGMIVCGLGGGFLALVILALLLQLVCCAWVAFSDKFRDICKAESLIFEYRKNRHEFMVWKHTKDGDDKCG